jgi:hypothetical protein
MSPEPAATTPNPNGGPKTEAGKATSSQNAITYGLFATRDFIRPDERETYDEFAQSLEDQLAPRGILELNLADEIRRAMWRLRRCSQIEESFSDTAVNPNIEDPMQQEATARLQQSVDRARSQTHRLLHKCTAELRKLQTDRQYRNETLPAETDLSEFGLADYRVIRKGIDAKFRADYHREKFTGMAEIDALLSTPIRPPSSFCKTQTAA